MSLLLDRFIGSSGVDLASHPLDIGGGWIGVEGSLQLNGVDAAASVTVPATYTADAGRADTVTTALLTAPTDGVPALYARYASASDLTRIRFTTARTLSLEDFVGGVQTVVGSSFVGALARAEVTLVLVDNQAWVYLNDASLIQGSVVWRANTRHGLHAEGVLGSAFEQFSVKSAGQPLAGIRRGSLYAKRYGNHFVFEDDGTWPEFNQATFVLAGTGGTAVYQKACTVSTDDRVFLEIGASDLASIPAGSYIPRVSPMFGSDALPDLGGLPAFCRLV